MKEVVSPIISSQRHTISTFVTTFAAAAIALPIALAFVPNLTKTQTATADTNAGTVSVASDPGAGSCTLGPTTNGAAVKSASSTLTVSTAPSAGTITTTRPLATVAPSAATVAVSNSAHVHDVNVGVLIGENALNGLNALDHPAISVSSASTLNGVLGSSPISADANVLTGTTVSLLN